MVIISVLDNRELGITLGADDYLLKPLDGDHLVRRLPELLPRRLEQPARRAHHRRRPPPAQPPGRQAGAAWATTLDHALTGQAGIAQARVRAPQVIILDLMMEGLDGFEVAGILRSDPRTADVPIIVFTAKDMSLQDRERLRGKIEACVEKGRTTNSGIVPVIEDVLRRRAKEGNRARG